MIAFIMQMMFTCFVFGQCFQAAIFTMSRYLRLHSHLILSGCPQAEARIKHFFVTWGATRSVCLKKLCRPIKGVIVVRNSLYNYKDQFYHCYVQPVSCITHERTVPTWPEIDFWSQSGEQFLCKVNKVRCGQHLKDRDC